ncbi:hypothetical protein SVIOM74S_08542 [Streptomyces violarus]
MARSVRLVPALTAVPVALALTACGGVHGTPGGSGVRDPYFPKAGNGGYDVTHYGLRLDYDRDAHHLTGTATVTARATKALSAFNLDLVGLDVGKVTVGGETARWNRAGQELTVRPGEDIDRDETFRVTVHYSGAPETVTDPDGSQEGWLRTSDGALALGEPTGSMAWFPGNHHPSDKASYDLTVTVPQGLRAVSNGELRSERTERGRTTFVWRTAEPMASYLATLAIGDFGISRSTARDGLPVYTAVDPAEKEGSRAVLARIPEVLRWAERRFGPYPFSSTGVIVDRAADIGYALETQSRPVFPGAPDMTLLVHELAHQWYGDSVSPEAGGTCGSTRASRRTRSGSGRRTTSRRGRGRGNPRAVGPRRGLLPQVWASVRRSRAKLLGPSADQARGRSPGRPRGTSTRLRYSRRRPWPSPGPPTGRSGRSRRRRPG